MDFEVTATQTWLTIDVQSGSLEPGETTTITVCLDSSAAELIAGEHVGSIEFLDTTNVRSDSRAVLLSIIQPPSPTSTAASEG